MCRVPLKVVPDFLLTFPNGAVWSIDYVTGFRGDERYHNYIQKRMQTYQTAGFKPFFFIDSSWLADVPDRALISFYNGEQQMSVMSDTDKTWGDFISEFFDAFGKPFILREMFGVQSIGINDLLRDKIEVFSLAYLDPEANTCTIQRFIPTHNQKFGYQVYRASISIERATSLDPSKEVFMWYETDETEAMQSTLQSLSARYESQKAIEEERAREERLKRQRISEIEEGQRKEYESSRNEGQMIIPLQGDHKSYTKDLISELTNVNITNFIVQDMTVPQANQILSWVRSVKSNLTPEQLESIRSKARLVLGPLRNPNPMISAQLRSILIDIAMV